MLQVLEKTEHKIPTRVADVTFEVVGVMQSERQRKLRMALDGGGTAHTSLDAMQAAEQEHMLNEQQCARRTAPQRRMHNMLAFADTRCRARCALHCARLHDAVPKQG